MCELVGTANPNSPPHQQHWFRNIFTEPINPLPACNVPDELIQPWVPKGAACELLTKEDFTDQDKEPPLVGKDEPDEEDEGEESGAEDKEQEAEVASGGDEEESDTVSGAGWLRELDLRRFCFHCLYCCK